MSLYRFKQLLGLAGATLALSFLSGLLVPQPAAAAGEIYTWKDNRTITVSGGDVKTPSDILLTNAPVSGDQSAIFTGNILYNKGRSDKGCTVSIQIYLFKASGNSAGRTWNPPPYDGPIAGDPNAPPRCSTSGAPEMDAPLHDKWIGIGGTRPGSTDNPEREEEKRFDVYVFAPDPLSRVPASDTVFIYKSDGTLVGQQSSPFKDDSGAADWPPDQTPAAMRVTFNLEPGDYVVCDTYVAKECNYAKATQAQKFKKEKYKASSINIGKLFQTPDKKRINGRIEYHTKRSCGATLNLSPVGVELTGPDGQKYTKSSAPAEARPTAGEDGALCMVDVVFGLEVPFENMGPGTYKACTTGATCVNVTKVDGEAASFTLVVLNEATAPPNEKVCTSGEGIAGALAWIICPAVQLIANGTKFFEENIIIPFMTVSPLTTNNDNPIYILWRSLRDFANVGFIVLLLFSILSIALSKYGMKRVLPRLFIVAIGINLSYFIIAIVIDAFNILGAGISQFVMAALKSGAVTQLDSGTSASPASMFALGGAALAAIILTGGSAIGWLFSLIGLVALIIVLIVGVLILRQLGIIMLVIVSPVAILMAMLPNADSLFTKWRDLLIKLLVMYPMIVLLFAAGKILGFILQQPDFTIIGDGVTDDVAQAVRVILQLVAYVLPFIALPATFAASNKVLGKIFGAAIQPRLQRLGQDAATMAGETRQRAANSGIPGLSHMAGRSLRKNYVRDSRARNLSREQEDYVAGAIDKSGFMRRQAAGVAGSAGQLRAAASAAQTAAKGRTEDLSNEMALLNDEMRRLGMDEKSFAGATGDYYRNPSAATRVITGSNGQTFNFAENETRLQRALLNSAASQGEITAIEAARANAGIDQTMLDDIIRRNDGELKKKGGYHLATDFKLAAGRMEVHDPSTGAVRAPANRAEMDNEMIAQRLVAMAKSGPNSIANMKSGMLDESASLMGSTSAQKFAVKQAMYHIGKADGQDYRKMLKGNITRILTTPETLNDSDMDAAEWTAFRNGL